MDNKARSKSSSTHGEELDKILQIIKSCLASTKDGCLTIDQLHRDYKQLVGSPIPFRKFQHATLDSFLQSFPEMIEAINRGGQLYVKAVTSSATSHIVSLVKGQKRSKGRGSIARPNIMRRPMNHTPWRPPSFPHGPRRYLLPNPVPQHFHMMGNGRGLPMHNSQPLKNPKSLPVNGNPYIPRPPLHSDMIPRQTSYIVKPFKSEVEKIARDKGITYPKYEVLPIGKRNNFICNLILGDQKFSSYPDERKTAEEAVELACKKAMEFYKGISKPSILRETNNFDKAAERVIQILKKSPEGPVWWNYIRDCYEKEFHESIAENWVEEARRRVRHELQIENPVTNGWTLQITRATHQVISNSTGTADNYKRYKSEEPNMLKLPDDNMWNVFVSYVKDCSELWFRLIEDEYSSAFEEFVTQMELHYFDEKNQKPVTDFVMDGYYICQHEDSWFRIRLVNVEGDMSTVFFIDHGDTETLSPSKLFCLDAKFLTFPCQSISASLCGFEFGFKDQLVLSELQKMALGKTLVAEVLSREDNLSVVLYDTSTADDININEQLMQMLPNIYPTPTFPSVGGICEAYVSHITSDGDIYVKLESATYKVLESLFHTAKKRAEEILGNDSLSIDMGKLYLAKFSADGEWHRAAPRSVNRDSDGKCLPCRLHNVPSKAELHWTPKVSERLISMLPSRNEPLLLKVIKEGKDGGLTEVDLLKRVHPQNLLVSIAATVDVETSLFRSEDDNNNCHGVENDKSSSSFASNEVVKKELSHPDVIGKACDVHEIIVPPLPEIRSYFDVFVTNAASPFNFAVQSWKDAMKLEWLMGEMRTHYSNSSNLKKMEDLKQGGYFAFQHNDDSWYRVRIDKIMDDFISGTFIDYGDVFCSNSELSQKVQPLLQNFRQLPYQAFKAKLGGIIPINKDWTPEDSFRFRELVENRPFVSIVTSISAAEGNNPPTLVLRLIDTTDPSVDKYIDEILVSENRAQKSS